jgi:hypothetical protein
VPDARPGLVRSVDARMGPAVEAGPIRSQIPQKLRVMRGGHDEAYAVLSEDFLEQGPAGGVAAPSGFALSALEADLHAVTG